MKNSLAAANDERYRGHINLCEIDLSGQKAITEARVLIAGAGGLGSPVALYLAAAGVGTIGIADADTVSLSNLQRQIMHGMPDVGLPKVESAARAMKRINPDVDVEIHNVFLSHDNAAAIIERYDVVADCTDRFATRLLVSDVCRELGKPMVHAAVERFRGQLFTQTPGSSTFRDIFGTEERQTDECGCAATGILNTVVGVAGSLQATEVIKIIAGTGEVLVNRLLTFDTLTMSFDVFNLG
ncbi:MAG: HesA/MoeB/ThiF family protein [Bacteroides sp.]|nr:HesA/MoeB/ThiF family protein [Bacteroides sp.]